MFACHLDFSAIRSQIYKMVVTLCQTICTLCPTFEKIFCGIKVWHGARKIGIGRKTVNEINQAYLVCLRLPLLLLLKLLKLRRMVESVCPDVVDVRGVQERRSRCPCRHVEMIRPKFAWVSPLAITIMLHFSRRVRVTSVHWNLDLDLNLREFQIYKVYFKKYTTQRVIENFHMGNWWHVYVTELVIKSGSQIKLVNLIVGA